MKIEGPGRAQQTDKTKKKDRVSGDGSFISMIQGGPESTGQASASKSIAQIDTLLALQSAEDPTERAARKRMQSRAGNILDELEKLRTALLTGRLTVGHVVEIAGTVAAHREKVMDPRLTAILDEIDLRAQIELAKLRVALDKQSSI
jgi:hypothetical protein